MSFSGNVTAGDLLVAVVAGTSANGVNTPTDSQGNVWTLAVVALVPEAPSNAMYFAVASATGPCTVTATITVDLSVNAINCIVAEYAGFTSVSVDVTNFNFAYSGTSLLVSTGFPTSQADELLVAYGYDSVDHTVAWTASDGFAVAQVSNNSAVGSLAYADQIVSAINTYATTFAGSGIVSGSFLAGAISSFQGTVGPSGPTAFEISLFGTKRYRKIPEPACVPAPPRKPMKLFETN